MGFKNKKYFIIDTSSLPQNLQFVIDSMFMVVLGSEISLIPKSLINGINKCFPPESKVFQGIVNKEMIQSAVQINVDSWNLLSTSSGLLINIEIM